MKTKLKIGGIIFIILIASLVRAEYSKKTNNISLLNVEALANGESGNIDCVWTGSVICPITGDKVYRVI